ncbi:hypothetical protein BG004_006800 [Podila humilis]|nr:hypothetical protein BG004_006800 [Podila humilis]
MAQKKSNRSLSKTTTETISNTPSTATTVTSPSTTKPLNEAASAPQKHSLAFSYSRSSSNESLTVVEQRSRLVQTNETDAKTDQHRAEVDSFNCSPAPTSSSQQSDRTEHSQVHSHEYQNHSQYQQPRRHQNELEQGHGFERDGVSQRNPTVPHVVSHHHSYNKPLDDASERTPLIRSQSNNSDQRRQRPYIDGHKRIGALLFVISYTVACTLFLPGSLFTIGAGFLFKPFPLALLIVLLGDVFAAVGSFVFGRYVFYDWVKGMMSKHPKFGALDQVIQDDGWKIVVMLRLTPIPFNLITYFFSITSIRLWTVIWATCVGVFPGSCLGIWIGSLLKGLSGIDNPELERKNVVILVMNGVFIVCCILALSLFGKRSLRKAMKRLDQHQALTNMHEVEATVQGVVTVTREQEDSASIPPSLRSTMIEQLAAEENQQEYYYRSNLESIQQLLDGEEEAGSSSGVGTWAEDEEARPEAALSIHSRQSLNKSPRVLGLRQQPTPAALPSSGFTRGEKITFVAIAAVAVVNVCVCVPLFYHFANKETSGEDSGSMRLSPSLGPL